MLLMTSPTNNGNRRPHDLSYLKYLIYSALLTSSGLGVSSKTASLAVRSGPLKFLRAFANHQHMAMKPKPPTTTMV